MLVDNKQIAKAVFFKLYYCQQFFAASRLAAALFQYSTITLTHSDTDCLIESELKYFGCRLAIICDGDVATFNFQGKTEIDTDVWRRKIQEIYN